MKKMVMMVLLVSGILFVSSCSDIEPVAQPQDQGTEAVVDEGGEPLDALVSSNITFGIYCETIPLTVKWDVDTKMDIWNGMTVVQQSTYRGEGKYAWKFTGTGSWMGMGIRVNPLTAVRNMSAFSGGYLSFMFKGTKRFKVGIKSVGTTTVEKWLTMTNGKYGFYNNNVWCVVRLPLSVFSGIDLSKIQQYFMFSADSTMGYTVGSVYYIDKVYWYKTVTYNNSSSSVSSTSSSKSSSSVSSSKSSSSVSSVSSVSSKSSSSVSSATSFDPSKALVLYAETLAQNVVWGVDINTNQSPSSPNELSFVNTTAGEGSQCFKIKVNSNFFNVNWLRYPLVTYLDLTPYANGTLNFMIKATKYISVSIHMVENYDIMVHLTNDGMYGFHTNNQWCSVSIPMSYFAGSLDLTRIYGYLKFYGGWYEGIVGGEEYYIDKVYFYK